MEEVRSSPPASDPDVLFGRQLVEHGLAKPEHVEECLALLRQLSGMGVNPLPKLGELLLRKGYVLSGLDQATVRLSTPSPEVRSGAGERTPHLPPAVSEASRDPANLVGKYVRVSRLGVGGMSEVWGAWDRELGRWVALKFMKGEDPEEFARFKREAQTAGKLAHPNIAAIYEVGEHQGKPFIAMQYVEGMTLATFPREDTRLLVEIVQQSALATHYAHERGVIHRDIKPANIMVASGGTSRLAPGSTRPKPHVYVMDFGLAKAMDVDVSLSVSGTVVGTPTYMSPEQARGARDIDPRTDVYSFGASLYELLTDTPVFQDTNAYLLLRKVVEEEPVPLRKLKPRINSDLETIVMKCLEKDRKLRYGTALALAEDLARWLEGEAILAHPPSFVYRIRKTLAKRKALTAVAAVACAAALGFAVYRGAQVHRASGWAREARGLFEAGRHGDAKRLLDQARAFIKIDEDLYRRIEARLQEDTARSEGKRREDQIFGPIFAEIARSPDGPDQYRRLIKLLDEGLARFAGSWEAWMRKARLHERLDELDEALEAYERAYTLNPLLRADAAVSRGVKKRDQGDLEGAEMEFSAALEVDPRHFEALVLRGGVRRSRGDAAGALADLRRALDLAPSARRAAVEKDLHSLGQ